MDFFSSLLIAYCIYLVVSTWTNSLRTANCVTFMCTHDNNTAVRDQRNILLLVKNIFFSANANLVTILRQLICSGGKWPALKTHVQTSWQYLRSTDLPSLLTQSSILVFRPIPHTALALNRHVLQSSKTNTHTQILSSGFSSKLLNIYVRLLVSSREESLKTEFGRPDCSASLWCSLGGIVNDVWADGKSISSNDSSSWIMHTPRKTLEWQNREKKTALFEFCPDS